MVDEGTNVSSDSSAADQPSSSAGSTPSSDNPTEQAEQAAAEKMACGYVFRARHERRLTERKRRAVHRLKNFLQRIAIKIKELRKSELSLDDMDEEDSAYLLETRYCKKAVKVMEEINRITYGDARFQSYAEANIKTSDLCSFPAINAAIAKILRKKDPPNFQEVKVIVEKHLPSDAGVRSFDLANRILFKVIYRIKEKRLADYRSTCGIYDDSPSRFACTDPLKLNPPELPEGALHPRKRLDDMVTEYVNRCADPSHKETQGEEAVESDACPSGEEEIEGVDAEDGDIGEEITFTHNPELEAEGPRNGEEGQEVKQEEEEKGENGGEVIGEGYQASLAGSSVDLEMEDFDGGLDDNKMEEHLARIRKEQEGLVDEEDVCNTNVAHDKEEVTVKRKACHSDDQAVPSKKPKKHIEPEYIVID